MDDKQISSFIADLGKLGFVWQFITLAGFHANSLAIDLFARDFAKRGMLAYVEGVQRQERENGVETLQQYVLLFMLFYHAMSNTMPNY
jgi:isocitrate lyase